MAYLDQILNIAEQSPTPEEAEYLKHIRALGAGAPTVENAKQMPTASIQQAPQQAQQALQYEPPPPLKTEMMEEQERQYGNLPQRSDYPVSGKRNIGSILAGIGEGILTRNPTKAMQVAENVKYSPYNRALADYQTRQEALKPAVEAEKSYNVATEQTYARASKAATDVANTNIKQETQGTREGTLALSTKKEADTLALKNQDLLDKMSRAGTREELEGLKLQFENINQEANRKSREGIADKNLAASQNRFNMNYSLRNAEYAEKRGDVTGASDSIYDAILHDDDPAHQQEIFANASPDVKNNLLAKHPEIGAIPKHTSQELNADKAAKVTQELVGRTKQNLMQPGVRDLLGAIHGRLEQGKIAWSSTNPNLQALVTDMNNLPIAEAAANGAGRSTGILVNMFKRGTGSLKDNYDTFLRALDETNEYAKLRRIDPIKGLDFNKDFSIVGGTK